jgi:hypothetical protein
MHLPRKKCLSRTFKQFSDMHTVEGEGCWCRVAKSLYIQECPSYLEQIAIAINQHAPTRALQILWHLKNGWKHL